MTTGAGSSPAAHLAPPGRGICWVQGPLSAPSPDVGLAGVEVLNVAVLARLAFFGQFLGAVAVATPLA